MQNSERWVARIFIRFAAIYGTAKVDAMWQDVPDSERNEAWGAALSKFSAESIAKAVRDLPDNPSPWPPTLPEFIALVRAAAAERAHQVRPIALPDDMQVVEPERARALMADLLKGMKRVPG